MVKDGQPIKREPIFYCNGAGSADFVPDLLNQLKVKALENPKK